MATKKPNILIIWGDDIGWVNIIANKNGIMGYRTPNIDRVAKEGALFTDWYGQQSCTAGRAAFITGQSPIRTGLTKVGLPGAAIGLQKQDPKVEELGQLDNTIVVFTTDKWRRGDPPTGVSRPSRVR